MNNKMNITPIEKMKTTKEVVYEQIKNAIFNGDISRDQLLTETLLAESFNVSRTPIREAVSDLISEGLLISLPRKGLKVRQITSLEKEQIIYLRLSIETEGLRRLIPRVTAEEIAALREIIEEQKLSIVNNDRIKFIEMDQKFHQSIVLFSEQNLLGDILLHIYNLSRLIGHQALAKSGRMEEVIKEHSQIIDALENKDLTLVENHMQHHLGKTSESITLNRE